MPIKRGSRNRKQREKKGEGERVVQRHGRGRVEGGGERAGPDLIEQPRIKREISEGGGVGGLRKTAATGRRGGGEGEEKRARGRRETKRERRRTPAATANRLRGWRHGTPMDGVRNMGSSHVNRRAQRLSREVSRAPSETRIYAHRTPILLRGLTDETPRQKRGEPRWRAAAAPRWWEIPRDND